MPIIQNIYYHEQRVESQNPPIVLIHGAGGNYLSWSPEIRRMRSHNVYALDLPGHGKSRGHGEQRIQEYADRLAEWMEAARIFRAVVVGHSMGGAITLHLAAHYPSLVSGIGLFSTGARLPVNPQLVEALSSDTTYQSALNNIVKWSFSRQAPDKLVELFSHRMTEVRRTVMQNDMLACDHFNMSDRLSDISQPALVLCGSKDKMTPLRFSQVLEKRLQDASMVVVQDAGHMVILEQPQVVVRDKFA
jgi:pimeloyl-ACP methyl ester carboxylesterase